MMDPFTKICNESQWGYHFINSYNIGFEFMNFDLCSTKTPVKKFYMFGNIPVLAPALQNTSRRSKIKSVKQTRQRDHPLLVIFSDLPNKSWNRTYLVENSIRCHYSEYLYNGVKL